VFLDAETTGLHPENGDIVDLGAVGIAWRTDGIGIGLVPEAREDRQTDPLVAAKKSRITKKLLEREGTEPAEAYAALLDWLKELRPEYIVAHNRDFDEPMLRMDMGRHVIDHSGLPRFKRTLAMARAHLPDMPKHGLDELAKRCGVENPQAHRAMGDAETTAACFFWTVAEDARPLDEGFVKANGGAPGRPKGRQGAKQGTAQSTISAQKQPKARKPQKDAPPSICKTAAAKTMVLSADADMDGIGKTDVDGPVLAAYGREFLRRRDAWERSYTDAAPEEWIGRMVRYARHTDGNLMDTAKDGTGTAHEAWWQVSRRTVACTARSDASDRFAPPCPPHGTARQVASRDRCFPCDPPTGHEAPTHGMHHLAPPSLPMAVPDGWGRTEGRGRCGSIIMNYPSPCTQVCSCRTSRSCKRPTGMVFLQGGRRPPGLAKAADAAPRSRELL